jgi:mannose-6-phosphate isomerase-like protein (cupin superfamily)
MSRTTPSGTSIDLRTHHLQLDGSGSIHAEERSVAVRDATDWRLALYHAETGDDIHANQWEMHPLADEAVCCLSGSIRMYLRSTSPDAPDDVVQMVPGRAVIVPRGRWHRIELDEPSKLLAVTVGRGTELADGRPARL